jgi:serine phosphatase RsbU (regulator of sigma subunit)
VLSKQFDEEIGLRGYLATKQPYLLDPYTAATDDFAAALKSLKASSRQLDIPGLAETLDEMDRLHHQWETRVAKPLTSTPAPKDPLQYEFLGKVLVDQLRSDANRVSQMLDTRLTQAQLDLRWRINQTLGGALLSILVFGTLGLIFVGSRRRMLARIERERRIIETLQRAFRTGWDELPGSRIGTAYVSATRDASVGGDLFDIRRMDRDRGLLVVADVSGKGIEAAVNTAFVKYSIRTLALSIDDPGTILATFNRMFLDTIKDPGLFVVAFVGILDAAALRLTYASAGHSGAFLRRGSDVRQLRVTGPIIGLERDFTYETETVDLQPSDLLVLATDGLTEARDRSGNTLEEAGAMRLLRDSPTDPQACADELVSAVRRRSVVRINEKQPDVARKRKGAAA